MSALRLLVATFAAAFLLTATASAQRSTHATAGLLADDTPDLERASCILILRSAPRTSSPGMGGTLMNGLADLNAVTTAMTTTGVIDPAAKSALGLGSREWPKVVRIELTMAGPQAVKLSVSVNPSDLKQKEPAAALMRELIERAKAAVSQTTEPRRREAKERLDELEKRRNEVRASLETLRKRLRDAGAGVNRGIDLVAAQRRQLEGELATKRPRLNAIKEMMPRYGSQTEEIDAALKGLVEARTALVAGLEKGVAAGKADALDLLRARAELAEAKVRAAEGGRFPGVTPSRNMRDERMSLEVDIAALETQLKALPTAESSKPADDPETLRAEAFRIEAENNTIEQQYQQARREYEMLITPPSLVVLDGQAK